MNQAGDSAAVEQELALAMSASALPAKTERQSKAAASVAVDLAMLTVAVREIGALAEG